MQIGGEYLEADGPHDLYLRQQTTEFGRESRNGKRGWVEERRQRKNQQRLKTD